MGILDKVRLFGGNEKPKYSFDAMYQILEDTNQKENLQELISKITLANDSEKLVLVQTLNGRMNALFADRGQDAIAEFTREFSEFTVKLNKSFVPEIKPLVVAETVPEDVPTNEVVPVVTPQRYASVWSQPVAEAPIIPISAQQRGLGVTANPEQRQSDGEAAMDRLIAEAKDIVPDTVTEKYSTPYENDRPNHFAQNDSLPGGANIDWAPAGPDSLKHPKPPEHLVK